MSSQRASKAPTGIGVIYEELKLTTPGHNLIDEITRSGGFRTIFDPFSHEWDMTTKDTKLRLLKRILELSKMSLCKVVELFKEEYKDRRDICHGVEFTLYDLLEWNLRSGKGP